MITRGNAPGTPTTNQPPPWRGGTSEIIYSYDRLGRQTTATQGGAATTFYRGLAGHLMGEAYTGGPLGGLRITNRYDHLLRRTNEATLNASQAALNSATYSYDSASRLEVVSQPSTPDSQPISATYSYLANSPLIEQVVFKQGTTTRMTTSKSYDKLNRLTSIASENAQGTSLSSFSYVYNSANQRTRATLVVDWLGLALYAIDGSTDQAWDVTNVRALYGDTTERPRYYWEGPTIFGSGTTRLYALVYMQINEDFCIAKANGTNRPDLAEVQ